MNKKYLWGLLASVAMVGCSDNNGLDDKGTDLDNQNGKDVYLTVNIMDASSLTKAVGGDPDSLINGSHNEHEVVSADFYFYDDKGIYVSKANVWKGGNDNGTDDKTTNEKIEYFGNSVVVLKGLQDRTFPSYMVTVLNAPAEFQPGATLDEMEKALTYAAVSHTSYLNGKYFIMSTTSYKHETKEDLPKYFVTKVKTTDFQKEPVVDPFNAIAVYVERLAAKVTLKVDNTVLKPVKVNDDGSSVYEIEWTVAGMENKDKPNTTPSTAPEKAAAEGGETESGTPSNSTTPEIGIGAEKLYVTFLGWDLNATAKHSYMMKNIDESWAYDAFNFAWNSPAFYRSYWGKSYNYGVDAYPKSANVLYGKDDKGETLFIPNDYLTYVSYAGSQNKIGSSDYCAENTNTVDVLKKSFGQAVTSILLKAKITTDLDGATTPDFVSYHGMLFKENDYLAYVLNRLQNAQGLNVWYKASVTPDIYRQWDTSFVVLKDMGDAKTNVVLKDAAPEGKSNLYRRWIKKNEEGVVIDTVWVPVQFVAIKDSINNVLAAFNNGEGAFEAIAYKGGMMYYNIPIEHLNDKNTYRETHNVNELKEANYGVVRNHLYEVTITSLKNPGHGVFNPDEVIVPGTGNPSDSLFYVGAKINILSWKIVKQNVGL